MRQQSWILTLLITLCVSAQGIAQEKEQPVETKEPVFRVSKLSESNNIPVKPSKQPLAKHANAVMSQANNPKAIGVHAKSSDAADAIRNIPNAQLNPTGRPVHQLDRAIKMAHEGLTNMRSNIRDYSAILVKRERVNGGISDPSYVQVKIRNSNNQVTGATPFSIYMRFLKPRASAGREVIWVEGWNEGKLVAHEGSGLMKYTKFKLDPTGPLAMRNQRYPIYEAGLEKLIVKLIEKAERDRSAGPCTVNYTEGAKINNRPCTLIEVVHAQRRAPYEFHKAHVFIDDEMNIPVRYAAYDWPTQPGAKPQLIEEYTYVQVKLNVGLTDEDFNPDNPAYKYNR